MSFMSVKEAAQKWQISLRLVQKYCAQGRIPNCKKIGNSWIIPIDAQKPQDPRKQPNNHLVADNDQLIKNLMPLLNAAFIPGSCQQYISVMEDGPAKTIAQAEYHYFSGDPQKTVEITELCLDHEDLAIQLSAYLLYTYANLSLGQIKQARNALATLRNSFKTIDEMPPQLQACQAFINSAAMVLLHLPCSDKDLIIKDYLSYLPDGLKMFALYILAHQVYLQGEYQRSLGIIETTLILQEKLYPIPTIYLHLVAVMNHISLKQSDKAAEHLLKAWKLAQPDDLIEGFGEHHGLLGGMLEAIIKKDWPEDFKRIINITYRFSAGWRKIHNPVTGHDVADNLTTTEFSIAMLAARGWTNQEIAGHLHISTNTVKHYISIVLQKLNIPTRHELKKYMLK